MTLNLKVLPDRYTVYRFPCSTSPEGILRFCLSSEFFSITRTTDEISVIRKAPSDCIVLPSEHSKSEEGWRLIKVVGPLDFSLIGIMHKISERLACAGISIFASSTFDTDYILVKDDKLNSAIKTLNGNGMSCSFDEC